MPNAITVGAAAPGPVTPGRSDEGLTVASGQAFKGQETTDSRDCAETGAVCKSFTTLQARLGRAGFSLFELADNTFLVTRWGLVKPCADLRAVALFLRHVGVS
jgi:hypothetical protein